MAIATSTASESPLRLLEFQQSSTDAPTYMSYPFNHTRCLPVLARRLFAGVRVTSTHEASAIVTMRRMILEGTPFCSQLFHP